MKVKDVIELLSDIPLEAEVYVQCGDDAVSPRIILEPITDSCVSPVIIAYILAAIENKPMEKMN